MNQSLWRLLSTYLVIIATIYICEMVSFWFYPVGILILGNQYLILTLFGHEAAHGLIHSNKRLNRTIGRYLCHFPFLISHTHYSMNHLRHHRNLGTHDDPDVNIYQNSYSSFTHWIQTSFINLFNLTLVRQFLDYFNGAGSFLRGNYPFKIKTDYLEFFGFWGVALLIVFSLNIQLQVLLYWFLPLLFILPWVRLLNSYQHYSEDGLVSGRAYNILFKNKLLNEFLFPLNVNYHETHHQRPDLPYYMLRQKAVASPNSVDFGKFSKTVFNSQKNKTL